MKINYAQAVFDYQERIAVSNSMMNTWLAAGVNVTEFEKKVARKFGKRYGLATNSGSSANLLAVAALNLPHGAEVITPALTFATTVAPIVQLGLKPVFVDAKIGSYTIDEDKIEKSITAKSRVLLVPQLIGGLADMKRLRKIADKHNLILIEDSCDTIAPPSSSDIVTTSFYGSHLITTMGTGGMVMTDSRVVMDQMRLLTNWGRTGTHEKDFKKRFDFEIDTIPYDSEFVYEVAGYNLRMTEGQAAFGLAQLDKLATFSYLRKRNYNMLTKYFKNYEKWFYLPDIKLPLAYPLTIKANAPFTRKELLKHLDKHDVQVRVLFSGNITRHTAYRAYLQPFANADLVMANGFLVGCHQGMEVKDIDLLITICEEFLSKYD